MPKTASLEIEKEPVAGEQEASQVSPAMAKGVADLIVMLTARLDELSARLERVEQIAHAGHEFSLGKHEVQAIGEALTPHIQQQAVEAVSKHLGIAPPAIRGDEA